MSNEVFPALPGIKWGSEKSPEFATKIKTAVSGYEVRLSNRAYPLYRIKLGFEFLRTATAYQELQAIAGLFLRHRGSGDSFLLLDAADSVALDQAFGAGDGTRKLFYVAAAWAGFVQPARNIKSIGSITINGAATTAYTLGADGSITFATAPAAGAVLRWSGSYYYRCRFSDDTISPRELLQGIWDLGRCELVGALGNQIG